MEFASELLVRAGRSGLRICEIATRYSNRVGESKLSTFSDGWRHFRQIVLLAPYLLLLFPGMGLLIIGIVLQAFEFANPSGISVGTVRWEPVFLAGISLVIGTQATIVGLVARDRSYDTRLIAGDPKGAERRWFKWILPLGTFAVLAGGFIDALLLLRPVFDSSPFALQEPLASLASSALINGISLMGFGFLYPLFERAPMRVIPPAVLVRPEGEESVGGGVNDVIFPDDCTDATDVIPTFSYDWKQ